MKRIGLLSDTHGCWDDNYMRCFSQCDEVWHAGDIGSREIIEKFEASTTFRAVHGNIDGADIRIMAKETLRFDIEGMDVMIKHIAGYPGHYDRSMKTILENNPPKLLVCGHSHILRVMFDKKHDMLVINPGAAGQYGFHKTRTLIRFTISNGKAADLEVIELPRKL